MKDSHKTKYRQGIPLSEYIRNVELSYVCVTCNKLFFHCSIASLQEHSGPAAGHIFPHSSPCPLTTIPTKSSLAIRCTNTHSFIAECWLPPLTSRNTQAGCTPLTQCQRGKSLKALCTEGCVKPLRHEGTFP